jgi:hypothetical protein
MLWLIAGNSIMGLLLYNTISYLIIPQIFPFWFIYSTLQAVQHLSFLS